MSNLEWHSCPVLSLALLMLTEDSASQCLSGNEASLSPVLPGCLLVSGATDGGLALWHLQQPPAASQGQAAGQVEAQRLLCLPGHHQSGVNAASIAILPCAKGEPLELDCQDKLEHSSGCYSKFTTLMNVRVPVQVLHCVRIFTETKCYQAVGDCLHQGRPLPR